MGSSKPQEEKSHSTTVKEPWAPAAQDLFNILGETRNAYYTTPKNPWAGEYIADPNAVQLGAANEMLAHADNAGTGAGAVRNLAMDTIGGKYLMPGSNPALQGAIDAAWNPIQRDLTQSILPAIMDTASSQGAFGGSRYALQQSDAIANAAQRGNEVTGKIAYDNYARERQNQLTAPSLLPQATQIELTPAQIKGTVGTQMQQWDQAKIDEAFQHYLDQQNAPWIGLDRYQNSVLPMASGFGVQTTDSTSTKTPASSFNPIAGAFQGMSGGLGIASAIGSLIPGMQWLSLPLAIGGGAAGAFR